MFGKRKKEPEEPHISIVTRIEPPHISVSIPVYPTAAIQARWRQQVLREGTFSRPIPQLQADSEHYNTSIEVSGTPPQITADQNDWLKEIHEVDPLALRRVITQIPSYLEAHANLSLPLQEGLRRMARVAQQVIQERNTTREPFIS